MGPSVDQQRRSAFAVLPSCIFRTCFIGVPTFSIASKVLAQRVWLSNNMDGHRVCIAETSSGSRGVESKGNRKGMKDGGHFERNFVSGGAANVDAAVLGCAVAQGHPQSSTESL